MPSNLLLVRSARDGVCFDQARPVRERYAGGKAFSHLEIWSLAYQLPRITEGKTLRIIVPAAGTLRLSCDSWGTFSDRELRRTAFGCWYADIPASELVGGAGAVFTFRWQDRWEGRDFHVLNS